MLPTKDARAMNIVIEEDGPGVFSASLDGTHLCRSRTPLLSAARILLKAGADGDTELTMSRADGVVSMRTTVGDAASLSVLEPGGGGVRFVPFRERPGTPGMPIASPP
jgi:hypothetical protein